MSFILKGGYDVHCRHIVNLFLKRTTVWNRGSINVNGNKCNIDSTRENTIEIIKYDDMNSLLLNNAIIYENRRPFIYDIELQYNNHDIHDFSNKNIYSYVDFNVVNYNKIKNISSQRLLN